MKKGARLPVVTQPLTETHLEMFNRDLQRLDELAKLMDQHESTGVNVDEHRQLHADLRDQINRMKAAYFPGR